MCVKAIRNDQEYEQVLARIEQLLSAGSDSTERDELDVLAVLCEAYERKRYAITDADPVDVLAFAFEQQQTTPADKARIFGGANRASEVMNRTRRLTLPMIQRAHDALRIPLDVLVRDYPVNGRYFETRLRKNRLPRSPTPSKRAHR